MQNVKLRKDFGNLITRKHLIMSKSKQFKLFQTIRIKILKIK